jgi:plastocyanin
MTDTTDVLPDSSPAESVAADPVPAEPIAAEPIPFWKRPNVERYLLPLVLPIVVVLGLVVFVLNLSRVFLSAHGNTAVTVGSVLTVLILVGATVLSNASRLRSSSIALMTTIFLLVIFTSGWLVLGHSQEKNAVGAPLPAAGPAPAGKLALTALPALKFAPARFTVKTGIYSVSLTDGGTGPHTLDFDDPSTLFAGLAVNSAGEKVSSRIFFGAPGDYTYFCAIPGHRTAGMQGVVQVTGAPMTLAQAEAAKPAK